MASWKSAHIVEDKAHKEVEGDAEKVEDGCALVLRHILAA
jgi:hypothetical protein